MKTFVSSFLLLVAFSLSAFVTSAKAPHTETATFTVHGNCSMCKDRIESTLKKNSAVKKASWNQDTKVLTVTYDPNAISLDQIHAMIAAVGHDTDKVTATNESYLALPACCCSACCKYRQTTSDSAQQQKQCATQTSSCCSKSNMTCCSK